MNKSSTNPMLEKELDKCINGTNTIRRSITTNRLPNLSGKEFIVDIDDKLLDIQKELQIKKLEYYEKI